MIVENIGEILMTAGFLFVVMAVFMSMKKSPGRRGRRRRHFGMDLTKRR